MDATLPVATPWVIRPLDADRPDEIALVAQRMRATLVEVLGEERGHAMYTLRWLEERVRWHLRPADCTGEVLVVEDGAGAIVGHTILRVEPGEAEGPLGLVSTTYVVPEHRRAGVAGALLAAGERWLRTHGARTLATDTSETNTPLLRLYAKHGYAVSFRAPEAQMVRLTKRL